MANFDYLSVYVAVIGVSVAGYGFALWLSRVSLLRVGCRTVGYVVDNQMKSTINRRVKFRPVVKFTTATGQDVAIVGEHSRHVSFVPNTRISVVYDPARPSRTDVGLGSAAAKFLTTGAVLIAVAIALAVISL